MSKLVKLNDLNEAVKEYSADCMDFHAQTTQLKFGEGLKMTFPAELSSLFGETAIMGGKLDDWAGSQLATRLDAPTAKWTFDPNHCPEELARDILNKLVGIRKDTRVFIRQKGDTVRAFLSDSYTVFDNKDLVDLTVQAVNTMGLEPEVKRVQVGSELSAYVLFPSITFAQDPRDDGKGGQLHPALHISNSERGGGTAKITGAVFSGYCQNGMIMGFKKNETMAVRHRFITTATMGSLVAQSIAIGLEMSEVAAKAFVASQEIKIPAVDLAHFTKKWAWEYGLTVAENENWLNAVIGETNRNDRPDDPRLFDVINGATWLAQQKEPVLAIQYEAMAGDILRSFPR